MRKLAHTTFVSILSATFIIAPFPQVGPTEAQAARGERTLWLHFTHTGEEKKITFRRNGKYVPEGIKQLQWILRDWRRNQATKMDPRLFDLIWSVYQEAGATKAIRVVSGFRSKKTNDSLRRRSRGVAKTSQHTAGRAMDFYIPGVPVRKLREIGLKMQAGGVGYYPGSKTPFVHMDTGSVRHWPRMTPKQVARLFPDGKTLHKDTNGRRGKRYAEALAEYQSGRTKVIQPLTKSKRTLFASSKPETKKKRSGGLLASLFNNDRSTSNSEAPTVVSASSSKSASALKTASKPTRQKAPKVIANKVTKPEAPVVPSRIGRPENPPVPQKPEAPVVLASVPAPRAVPEELRDQFTPAQSIVVAAAPAPAQRPAFAVQETVQPAILETPEVIVAKTDIPEADLPRAVDLTQTAALSRKDFDVPTPQIVQNRLAEVTDPTRLVLNSKLTEPTEPQVSSEETTLAYARATNPVEALPQLDADEFNSRFGQIEVSDNKDVNSLPQKVIKQLSVAERFAALELQPDQPSFSLADIGIKSEERQLALRKSLGLLDEEELKPGVTPIVSASLEPTTLALPDQLAPQKQQDTLKPATSSQESNHTERAHKSDRQVVLPSQSLTNAPGSFEFDGERQTIVETLLVASSISDEAHVTFDLPKPNYMPGLFVSPTRAFAGSFTISDESKKARTFTGEAITVTPTVDFGRAANIRLSWLSQ